MDFAWMFFTCFNVLHVLHCSSLIQMSYAKRPIPEIEPENITLPEGETLNAKCSINQPFSHCQWTLLSDRSTVLTSRGKSLSGVCDITIQNITEKHKGGIRCALTPASSGRSRTVFGIVTVHIAKAPRAPQISLIDPVSIRKKYPSNSYEENQTIQAVCKIEFGKPQANISWYIGNDRIKDGLSTPNVTDLGKEYDGQKKIIQTLERKLTFSDNGKNLRCVARHSALGNGTLHHPTFRLHVYFSPKLKQAKPLVLTIGQPGEIVVRTYANPKPTIEWMIDGEKIQEGDENGRFHAQNLTERDQSTWDAELRIDEVTFQDGEKNYTFTASNKLGKNVTEVPISVCYAPSAELNACLSVPRDLIGSTTHLAHDSTCTSFSPDCTVCPTPPAETEPCQTSFSEIIAWSIAGIVTVILLIILLKFVYSRLTQKGRSQHIKTVKGPDGWITCKCKSKKAEPTTEL